VRPTYVLTHSAAYSAKVVFDGSRQRPCATLAQRQAARHALQRNTAQNDDAL
jgi:hypothetical protein